MAGLALGVLWLGYAVWYYGFDQIKGGNNGFLDLVIPGRYKAVPNDGAGTDAGTVIGTPTPLGPVGSKAPDGGIILGQGTYTPLSNG